MQPVQNKMNRALLTFNIVKVVLPTLIPNVAGPVSTSPFFLFFFSKANLLLRIAKKAEILLT